MSLYENISALDATDGGAAMRWALALQPELLERAESQADAIDWLNGIGIANYAVFGIDKTLKPMPDKAAHFFLGSTLTRIGISQLPVDLRGPDRNQGIDAVYDALRQVRSNNYADFRDTQEIPALYGVELALRFEYGVEVPDDPRLQDDFNATIQGGIMVLQAALRVITNTIPSK